ncbi:MAG: tRNA lysidine(34) synthetase TilS [Aestuariibacter sp.]
MELVNWVKGRILSQVSASTRRLVIAYSGGVDSTVLLHLCSVFQSELPCKIHAIYIHHGLSDSADAWQAHCQDFAQHLDTTFEACRVCVSAAKKGIEAAAREARYGKLAEVTDEHDLILLGQHDDDQVETFLLQLLRGSGPDGLVAMPAFKRDKHGRCYLRPLLGVSRQTIENYANEMGLIWVEDESNASLQFDRNYLRHQVVPLLSQRFPAATKNILRTVGHLQEQRELLEDILDEKFASCCVDNKTMNISQLQGFSVAWQKQLLKRWIRLCNVPQPSVAVLQQIIEHCIPAAQDATPLVHWTGFQCRRYDGHLFLIPVPESCRHFQITLATEQSVELPNGDSRVVMRTASPQEAGFFIDELSLPIILKYSGYAAKFKPLGARHSKPLKQWFKEWKVPPWERERTPLLFSGEQLIQVGTRVSALAQPSDGSTNFIAIDITDSPLSQ